MRSFFTFIASVIAGAVITLLALAVLNGSNTPDCEHLYEEYSATVDMDLREHLFQDGLANGCFHHE